VDPNEGKKGSKLNSCKIRIHVHPNEGKKGSKLNTWLKSLIHLRFSASEQTHTWFEGHHSVNKGEYNYPHTLKVKKNGQVVVRARQLKIRKNLGNKSSLINEQNDIIWSLIGRHNSMHWEIASFVAIYVAGIYSGCREEWGYSASTWNFFLLRQHCNKPSLGKRHGKINKEIAIHIFMNMPWAFEGHQSIFPS